VLSDGTSCVRGKAKFAEWWQILMKAMSKFNIEVVTDSLSPWKTNFDVLPSQMGFERTFDLIPCRKYAKRWLANIIGTTREAAPNVAADVDVIGFQESHACCNAASVLHLPHRKEKMILALEKYCRARWLCTLAKTMFATCSRSRAAGERSSGLQCFQYPTPNCLAEHLASNFIASSQKR